MAGIPQAIPFPIRGVHKGISFDSQPPGTSPNALNSRGYDSLKNRLRGGRRPGLEKFLTSQVNGNNPIQGMWRVGTVAAAAETVTTVTDNFTSGTYTTAGKGYIGPDYVRGRFNVGGNRVANEISTNYVGAASNWVTFDRMTTGSVRHNNIMAIAYRTSNDITVVIRANGVASSNNGNDGLIDECHNIGPFIRGSAILNVGIGARLLRVGANQVQLQIFSFTSADVYTSLALSATQNLDGTATLTADCMIRLSEATDGTITAQLDWPSQGIAALSITSNSSVNSGNTRGGIVTSEASITGGDVLAWRTVKSITYTKYVPATARILNAINGTDVNTVNSDRYFIPNGWRDTTLNTTTGIATQTAGFISAAGDPAYISIDTTNDLIWDAIGNVANTTSWIEPTTGEGGGVFEYEPQFVAGSVQDIPGFGALVGDDGQSGLFFSHTLGGNPTNTSDRNETGCFGLSQTNLYIVSGGAITSGPTSAFAASSSSAPLMNTGGWVRMTYTPATFTFAIAFNGITLMEYTLSAPQQAAIAAFTGTRTVIALQTASLDVTAGVKAVRYVDPTTSVYPVDVRLVAVSGGTIAGIIAPSTVLSIPNGSEALLDGPFDVQGVEAYGKIFFVDGENLKYYDKATNTVSDWVATNGTLPVGPTLIGLYRGRIVLSGCPSDPHNWFMSAVGDPFNWNYSPAVISETQAVAGNNSKAGLVGDVITALITIGDDEMAFGCDHTIHKMEGDPAAGGSIILVSDQTGIGVGRAWAKDPEGIVFFWGQNGVYRWDLETKPINMTRGVFNDRFENLNRANNRVIMEWDYFQHGLHVEIVNVNTSIANTSMFWDARADAWWPDRYSATHGPNCMLMYDGPQPDDQAFLQGCRDGYIRRVEPTAGNDDGLEIESYVDYAPFIADSHAGEVILTDILPVLAGTSTGGVRVEIYTGQTAEECLLSINPKVRRLLTKRGRNAAIRHKIRGYALRLRLYHTGSAIWAVEGITVTFEPTGMPRRQQTERTNGS